GLGICRGLLRAGATVIASSTSRQTLAQVRERFGDPENLVTVLGTMQPEGAALLVQEVLGLPELRGRQLNHVVAHTSVRWWAKGDGSSDDPLGDSSSDELQLRRVVEKLPLMSMSTRTFMCHSSRLACMHHAAAAALVPHLQKVPGASYTFVNGGHSQRRLAIDQVNVHSVWGLAAALREELWENPVRVEVASWTTREPMRRVHMLALRCFCAQQAGRSVLELQLNLEIDRLAKPRELDPRPTPLSHDIGTICAGMAANAKGWRHGGLHELNSNWDILMMKTRYPSEEVYDFQ
ncbi:unnamed protein product, partial [Prorocentrum cordatum]